MTETVFVIGAGASVEYGFPAGPGLQAMICNRVAPECQPEQYRQEIEFLAPQLRDRGLPYRSQTSFFSWFARTLPLARSIDSFLEDQSAPGDHTSFLGKYYIAKLIGEAEQKSPLLENGLAKPDFRQLSETWLGKLWSSINRGGTARGYESSFEDISIITFNYDRCIEQFFYLAFTGYYRLQDRDAIAKVREIDIHHVYGSLGDPFDFEKGTRFGGGLHPSEFVQAAEKLKTYSERLGSDQLAEIKSKLTDARRVIFLGFSYSPINQKVLSVSDDHPRVRTVMGTCYGMSVYDQNRATDWCNDSLRRGHAGTVLQRLTAADFFDQNALLF